jgi:hypothetical protein
MDTILPLRAAGSLWKRIFHGKRWPVVLKNRYWDSYKLNYQPLNRELCYLLGYLVLITQDHFYEDTDLGLIFRSQIP